MPACRDLNHSGWEWRSFETQAVMRPLEMITSSPSTRCNSQEDVERIGQGTPSLDLSTFWLKLCPEALPRFLHDDCQSIPPYADLVVQERFSLNFPLFKSHFFCVASRRVSRAPRTQRKEPEKMSVSAMLASPGLTASSKGPKFLLPTAVAVVISKSISIPSGLPDFLDNVYAITTTFTPPATCTGLHFTMM